MKKHILFICILAISACSDDSSSVFSESGITVALATQPSSALVVFAIETGVFENHGIMINPLEFDSEELAISATTKKEIDPDIIFASDITFLANQHKLDNHRIVSTVFESDNVNALVSTEPFDIFPYLETKTLCTQQQSALHFFGKILVDRQLVGANKISFFNITELNNKLMTGDCDIVTTREPYLSDLKNQTGDNLYVKSFPGTYLQYELMLAHNRVSDKKLELILLALLDAEHQLYDSRDQLVEECLKTPGTLCNLLDHNIIQDSIVEVSLYQTVIPNLKREFSWLKQQSRDVSESQNIDVLIRTVPLNNVSPHRMTVVNHED